MISKILTLLARWRDDCIGHVSWSAPPWMRHLKRLARQRPLVTAIVALAILASGGGYYYYKSLPQPILVTAKFLPPGLTPNKKVLIPEKLVVEFNYDFSNLSKQQIRPDGHPSVARIDLVGKELATGVRTTPPLSGKWTWQSDRVLGFTPDRDWPPGLEYKVSFGSELFSNKAKLSSYDYSFKTHPLGIDIKELGFYQDPKDRKIRRVIATLFSSHPMDAENLKAHLSMQMRPKGSPIDTEQKRYAYSLQFDKNHREIYVQSSPVTLPSQPNYMYLRVAPGVQSVLKGQSLLEKLEKNVLVPDVFSFLKVSSAETKVIPNAKKEPEQILMLSFTDHIAEGELISKLSAYVLPERNKKGRKRRWSSPAQVDPEVLAASSKIDLKLIPNERSFSKTFNFVIDAPENRYLYVHIAPELKSISEFIKSSLYDNVLKAPAYPKEVQIMGEGSVLTHSGDHRLSILSRGLDTIKIFVGKVLPGQLVHLVSQTNGDIRDPHFSNYRFNAQNISSFKEEVIQLKATHPKFANYASFDLSKYLPETGSEFGLFFVEVTGWDNRRKRIFRGIKDKRLVMVTDLGILVKNNTDKTHDVFVQSIRSGEPVQSATIELIGKNGIPLFNKETNLSGHVQFPSTKGFTDSQKPSAYIIRTKDDISFIPFDRHSRQINFSKFDIGGARITQTQDGGLRAYVFTDRGIYRPGERANIGLIVKKYNLNNVSGIPLELVIRGPRRRTVKAEKFVLPEKGMFDYGFPTEATTNTGLYKVDLYLVRDNRRRGRIIGSGSFRIEEFKPDTLKIESKLLGKTTKGWFTSKSLKASIALKNLFGKPAQQRKVNAKITVRPSSFRFPEYKEYTFLDPFKQSKDKPLSIKETLEPKITDKDGLTEFNISLERFVSGSYILDFNAEGFEQGGGRSVKAYNRIMVAPHPYLVGYKSNGKLDYINKNGQRSIELIAVNSQLRPESKKDLTVKLLEIQHLSTLVKQKNGTYQYQTVDREKELTVNPLSISESGTPYILPTATPGDYVLEINDQHQLKLIRVPFSVVGHDNLTGRLAGDVELQLKLDKDEYHAGDLIELSIKGAYLGSGLITIESDKVHNYKWFKADAQASIQTIRVPEGLQGNAYVNVSLLRDVNSKEVFTSPLSYAVAPFKVDHSQHELEVAVSVEKLVRPGKEMEIVYHTSKTSKVIVFAIDEGILQVANYVTPNPLSHFLKKRSLGVTTLQILDLILPEFDFAKQASASGGGSAGMKALAKNLNPFSRKTDKPAIYWSGIVEGKNAEQALSFKVPDTFSGSLRVMAVAVSETAMGVAESQTLVRGPFVITPNLLTHAAPGDEFVVSVGIANLVEKSGKDAKIKVEVEVSNQLQVMNGNGQEMIIAEDNEGKADFRIKVRGSLGAANIKFIASLIQEGRIKEQGVRSAELSIRPAIPYLTSFESGHSPNGSALISIQRQLFPDLAKQVVSASASPLVLVEGLSNYLEHFPHGCTEQVVSQVFPLVGLMTHPGFEPHSDRTRAKFKKLIDKLRQRQLGNGGFSFWTGGRKVANYPSVYVMHFLIESRELGYPISNRMMTRGKDFLRSFVAKKVTTLDQARVRANGIYLLTRLGDVTTNHLFDLQRFLEKTFKEEWKSDLTGVYIAATYQLLQKKSEAAELIAHYELGARSSKDYGDFHSPLTQDAQYVYLLSKHFETRMMSMDAAGLLNLINPIFRGEYNTISAAYATLALGAYSSKKLNGEFNEQVQFIKLDQNDNKQDLQTVRSPFPAASYQNIASKISIESPQSIYYLNTQAGFDQKLPEREVKQRLEIYREFVDDAGKPTSTFELGKELTVKLKIRTTDQPIDNIAIIDLLPGGFEVIRSSVPRTAINWAADYVDVREDRVVIYGRFDTALKELSYKVKVTAIGKFIVPPAFAESMYDRSVKARGLVSAFEVTAPK